MKKFSFEDVCIDLKGEYYLKKYKFIPMEKIIKAYYNGTRGELGMFFEQNKDEVFERAKSTYVIPIDDYVDCTKKKYINKTLANAEMRRIQERITHNYKPIRSYYCSNCNHWHLTSKSNEILEKYEERTNVDTNGV